MHGRQLQTKTASHCQSNDVDDVDDVDNSEGE